MTDSMNFGPDWIRNLSSDGNAGIGTGSGTRYQLADYRYGREEMLALFDRNVKPPACLTNFKSLYSETTLAPLALLPSSEDEGAFQRGGWQGRPTTLGGPPRGRGGSLERGGRISRGRGNYPSYGRPSNYDGGWGNGDSSDWSPRKEYNARTASLDNWRRVRGNEEDEGWRNVPSSRNLHDKWGRSTSWRGEGENEERTGPPERGSRSNWHETNRGPPKRSWDNEDHLPEWANENPSESGGSFDERGAFHGSDDEQLEGMGYRREGLQKSTSQQHITNKGHPPLHTSKSTMSLIKDEESHRQRESVDAGFSPSDDINSPEKEHPNPVSEANEKLNLNKDRHASEGHSKTIDRNKQQGNEKAQDQRTEDTEFEKFQEDFVLKLVVDEEPQQPPQTHSNFDLSNLPPPPNLSAPGQDKWFYQDPQGQMQGPFTSMEMSEWFKAGYFGQDLKVRRHCDERFFLLGELMTMCGGSNPFQTTLRFPILKNDISKMPESDLQFQYLSQLAAYKQAQARVHADPWSALTLQQQEVAAQRLIMQQQQQVQPEMPYLQQPATNPLMHMISQMQQANKLPGLLDKPPQNMPGSLDPHMQMHMSNFLSLQNRLPSGLPNHIPTALPGGVPTSMPPDNLTSSIPGLQNPSLGGGGLPLPGMPNSLSVGLNLPVSRPVEQAGSEQEDPISSLLKQLQHKQQAQQVEALWQQNQFSSTPAGPPQQWQPPQVSEVPISMWDMQQQGSQSMQPEPQPSPTPTKNEKQLAKEKETENRAKDEAKEQKLKKEQEEKQQKKEAEEKRKQEQKRLEAEKKMEAEKKKKEEERIKKELEKAKKEAEEKRLRELEEKRRLKEQRKAEDEARKKAEEIKRLEEERMQREKQQREMEEKQRAEERRQEQISSAKVAPWSQANSALGMSLTEIQKAEKERKLHEAAMQQQRAQFEKEMQQQQQQTEKPTGLQLSWAKKPVEPRKVKSLAEIQAEEQERLAKEAAEARLKKEKEAKEAPQLQTTSNIWSGQNLTWANTSANSQWSSSNYSGFWEDSAQRVPQLHKPSSVSKSSSMSMITSGSAKQLQQQQQPQQKQQQQSKPKPKKEETSNSAKKNHNNNNGPLHDEFTTWCHKALANFSSAVDIPTFITFLRDIESAFEVREYCKEYLGESNTTQQFANNFLEKRRSFKPKNAHKDDMCSPAPAITPSTQHSMEFQEVKGKNKKNKKSKMLKVDSRILGFNVTSAPDRINVGDRDYGDNS